MKIKRKPYRKLTNEEKRAWGRNCALTRKKVNSSRLEGNRPDPYFNRKRDIFNKAHKKCINCQGKMYIKKEGNYFRWTCEDCRYTELKKSKR